MDIYQNVLLLIVFNVDGVPVVEVHRKEDDLDDMANTSFSDSLLDDE